MPIISYNIVSCLVWLSSTAQDVWSIWVWKAGFRDSRFSIGMDLGGGTFGVLVLPRICRVIAYRPLPLLIM